MVLTIKGKTYKFVQLFMFFTILIISKARCATTPFRVWFEKGTRALDAQGTTTP